MVPEAPLEDTDTGLVATGDGWFVLHARQARWRDRPGRGHWLAFEGEIEFPQIGIQLFSLGPGERPALPRASFLHTGPAVGRQVYRW